MLILRGGLYSGLNLDPDLSSRSLLLILLRESYEVTSRASTKQTQPQFGAEEKGELNYAVYLVVNKQVRLLQVKLSHFMRSQVTASLPG